jgi:hypothetical protein
MSPSCALSHSATRARDTGTASSNCTLMFLTPCRNTSAESKVLNERQRRLARMTALWLCCSTGALTTRHGNPALHEAYAAGLIRQPVSSSSFGKKIRQIQYHHRGHLPLACCATAARISSRSFLYSSTHKLLRTMRSSSSGDPMFRSSNVMDVSPGPLVCCRKACHKPKRRVGV